MLCRRRPAPGTGWRRRQRNWLLEEDATALGLGQEPGGWVYIPQIGGELCRSPAPERCWEPRGLGDS